MKKNILIIFLILMICSVSIVSSIAINADSTHLNQIPTYVNTMEQTTQKGQPTSIFGTTYMVEMRDGIHLATDVYNRAIRSAPRGTILIRLPYNKNILSPLGFIYSLLGWPTVIQDMRGCYASEGIDTVFQNSHTDGPDTLAWIANQSWCNGKIATFGPSALGINQYFMAGANPPNLSGQFIMVATPHLHRHAIYQGGQFRESLVIGWLSGQGSTYLLDDIYENENYTIDFWGNVTLDDKWQNVNVPAVHLGGWYDIFLQGTIEGYQGYQHLSGPGAQGKSKLIIGPWTHTGYITQNQGELIFPRNSRGLWTMRLFHDMLRQYTMGRFTAFDKWPSVIYYVMGDVESPDSPGNEWRYADDWPIPATQNPWYLHNNSMLSTEPSSGEHSITYSYDPTNPVPTVGGQNLLLPAGPYDQTSVEDRDDVIIFTSPVLEQPYEATGPIIARLFVSSDCPDTDFTVKLCDVYPDGRSMLITDGILRMRNRNGVDHWEFMEPGEIYEIEIDLWSTSYIWNAGHQIRVSISSSNYPRFLANPNTVDGIYQNTTYTIAQNTVHFGENNPSSIILPHVSQSTQPCFHPNQFAHPLLFKIFLSKFI
ncbi:MAG: CocE/NonD family hydrolase [Thermoplasmatota archaeon]